MAGQRAISRKVLPDVIADDLRERILNGELPEGETIRQEALAEEYDVSRMPIREALKRLDAEGLVQLTNNRGASVVKHSLREIGEIFDLRILIEVNLFRQSVGQMTAADFSRCADILAQLEHSGSTDNVGQWGALNYAFHSALYAAADRTLTNDLLHRINLQSDRYVRMHLSVMKQWSEARQEHRRLLALAKEGRTDEACELLSLHIGRTKDQLLDLIASKRQEPTG